MKWWHLIVVAVMNLATRGCLDEVASDLFWKCHLSSRHFLNVFSVYDKLLNKCLL